MEHVIDKYQLTFSSLVDAIQSRGLVVRHAQLMTNGCWKAIVLARRKKCLVFYRFTYNDEKSTLKIERRKNLFYYLIKEFKIAENNVHEILEKACSLILGERKRPKCCES